MLARTIRMASTDAKECRRATYGNLIFDSLCAEETCAEETSVLPSALPKLSSSVRDPIPLESGIKSLSINSTCEPVGAEL